MQMKDSLNIEFDRHFNVLDSAAKSSSGDSIYCCTFSIKFMETNTGVNAHSDGNYIGKLFFIKDDLRKWHEWYNSNK
jgi:hypothetical protein